MTTRPGGRGRTGKEETQWHPTYPMAGRPMSRSCFPLSAPTEVATRRSANVGKHFWIEDGKIGHGELRLTHSILLTEVVSVEVTERTYGGSGVRIQIAPGVPVTKRIHGTAPRQVTDITVRTRDGQDASWEIERRGADRVRNKIAPALRQAGIPFYEDLPLSERTHG